MDIKEKTALITLSLNVLLTFFKFLLFLFSGSLAVLAEAWHSFTDIATSFMVYLAVRKDRKNEGGGKSRVTGEQVVSILIGLILLIVAILLIGKFLSAGITPVMNPLVTGLIFIAFSLGNYLVYRFETSVGNQEKSVGLLSDGMHARTDMIASLVTGFSLILYHLGLDIDRWVAGIIALFVLSFAIETIVNVALAIARREKKAVFRYKAYTIVAKALSSQGLASAGRFLDRVLHIHLFSRKFVRKAPACLLGLGAAAVFVWWLTTCWFTVNPDEEAFVERFGKPTYPGAPLGPGLHFKAPWPIDRAVNFSTQSIERLLVGNQTEPSTFALLWTQRHGTEIPFISGDNAYFYPYLVVHYRVKSLYDYLYRHQDPVDLMSGLAHQMAGKVFATKSFYEIALDYREAMILRFKRDLQDALDGLDVGIEVVAIAMQDIHPPIMVSDAYEMVIASIQEKERMINEALGYRNQNLPETRGEAVRMLKDADGYALEMPLRSYGDARYFTSRIPGDPAIREVTRKRLWLMTMMEALKGRGKVIVDPGVGRPELWLNMKETLQGQGFEFEKAEF
jgi:membrane protease subunit HflK